MTDTNLRHKKNLYRQKRFFFLVILSIIISFMPSTTLGQVSPFIFFAGLIFFVQIRPVYHIKTLLGVFILYSFMGVYYWLFLGDNFSFINYYLFFITISSFLLFFFDFRSVLTKKLLERLGLATLIIITLEASYGIFQAVYIFLRAKTFDGSVGDFVWGTLAPPFDSAYSGRSPTFVVLITTLFLFSLAVFNRRFSIKYLIGFGVILLAWLLASLMHSLLYMGIAIFLALITTVHFKFSRKPVIHPPNTKLVVKKWKILLFSGFIGILFLTPILLPRNVSKIPNTLSQALDFSPEAKFLKVRAIYFTVVELPQDVWFQPAFGVGPGQYASRAALMASGQYLTRPIPGLPKYSTIYAEDYILPFVHKIESSLHFPSSSWLALYGELGLIGILFVVIILAKKILFFRQRRSKEFPRMTFMLLVLIYYLILMGLQNVYWEYTQAIFPAILSIKLCFDYLRNEFTTIV